ncbi:thioredoxin family protein [Halobacillus kuroshimensis]|uniref:Thioredoxin family protein n=2 Tax=Bacillaceae TaxID=186817 RepID=A0ABS3DVX9_9BACI|nr:thioredoxin family protein [Halobacillus kuroshimensis]
MTFIHSPFCGTCHLARKMLVTLEEMYKKPLFSEMNASLHPALMEQYRVESVPCLLITHKGEVLEKVYAFQSVPHMYEKIIPYL